MPFLRGSGAKHKSCLNTSLTQVSGSAVQPSMRCSKVAGQRCAASNQSAFASGVLDRGFLIRIVGCVRMNAVLSMGCFPHAVNR